MRRFWKRFEGREAEIIKAYARGERDGQVTRKRNAHNLSAEAYAKALLKDGQRKKWLPV